ncbi:hypothetical protein [Streptomyces sp. NPDC058953]|uniref:hypothetical protein n=1 Tax=unclassified Streptomyces TaxID=2593676 RepID=UPI0036CD634D
MLLRAKGRHRAGDGIWLTDETPLSPLSRMGRSLLGTGVALTLTAGVVSTVLLAVDEGDGTRDRDRIAGSTDLDLSDTGDPGDPGATPAPPAPSPAPETSPRPSDPPRTAPATRPAAVPAAGRTDTVRTPRDSRPAADAPSAQGPPRAERPTKPRPPAERPWELPPGTDGKPGWGDGRWQWDGDRDRDGDSDGDDERDDEDRDD